jgi:hypothetical protein
MSTPNSSRVERVDDRSLAVRGAGQGAEAWREAVHAQLDAAPDHADFYALAADLAATLRSLDTLSGLLVRQVADYGVGREVYDDEGANPAHRLRAAVLALAETRHGLAGAERAANRFWSAIGHIGVRYPREGERS